MKLFVKTAIFLAKNNEPANERAVFFGQFSIFQPCGAPGRRVERHKGSCRQRNGSVVGCLKK
jgi:hypothetical protein